MDTIIQWSTTLIQWLTYQLSTSGGHILASVMYGIVYGTIFLAASLFTLRRYNALLSKRHSFELLMTSAEHGQVTLAMWDLRLYRGSEGDGSISAQEILDDDNNKDIRRSFFLVMNHYQHIAQSVIDGFLDRKIVLKARFAGMEDTWRHYADVVSYLRARIERPHLWNELETFVTDPRNQDEHKTMHKSSARRGRHPEVPSPKPRSA